MNERKFSILDIGSTIIQYLQRSLGIGPSLPPNSRGTSNRGGSRKMRIPNFSKIMLVFGLLFLYLPLLLVIVYSFNDSRIVTIWSHFSFKWYGKLFEDYQMMNSAGFSLMLAAATATLAVIIGTMVAFTLNRMKKFRGRSLFLISSYAPLVIPDIILGLAMLLFFIGLENFLGFPRGRGFGTLLIAHTVFAQAFVSVIVLARLRDIDPFLEEAAMDLGAKPVKTFFRIILPVIFPALLSAWLLSFILSMDDVVIASFVSGPGSTTLPMNVFSSMRLGLSPKINVLATLIIAVVSLLSFFAFFIQRRAERKYRQEQNLAFAADQEIPAQPEKS